MTYVIHVYALPLAQIELRSGRNPLDASRSTFGDRIATRITARREPRAQTTCGPPIQGSVGGSVRSVALLTANPASMLYVNHVCHSVVSSGEERMSCRARSRKKRGASVKMDLKERLYDWRRRNDFSQSEAALKLQISTRTLQEWEQGRARPRHLALIAINKIIGG